MRPAAGAVLVLLLALAADAPAQPGVAPPPRPKAAPFPPLPAGAVARIGRPRLGHAGPAINVAFAPTGTAFVTTGVPAGDGADTNRLIVFWDAATGRELKQLRGHTAGVQALAFSADGDRLATGDARGKIRIWNLSDGSAREFDGSATIVLAVAFSPDGKRLASHGQDGWVRVWDAGTIAEVRQHPAAARSQGTSNVRYSPDGKLLAGVGADWAVRLWDAATGDEVRVLNGPTHDVLSLAFSRDGRRLAGIDGSGLLWVWDPNTGKELVRVRAHPAPVAPVTISGTCVRVSPDGAVIATGAYGGAIRFWDAAGKPLRSAAGHKDETVSEIDFSPDGSVLASVGHMGGVRLWDVATGSELPQSGGVAGRVALSPDGTVLATTGGDAVVRLWDTATGKERPPIVLDRPAGMIAFTHDGRGLVSSDTADGFRIWDPDTGKRVRSAGTRDGAPTDVLAVGPGGRGMMSAGGETVRLWKVGGAGSGPTALPVTKPRVCLAAFSPGDRHFAASGGDGRLRVHDVAAGRERFATTDFSGAYPTALAWAPDGRSLAVAHLDRLVRVVETASGRERQAPLQFPVTATRALAFSPDGRVLAAGGEGGGFRLWDVRTGRTLATRPAHSGPVTFLAFTPDSRFLVSAGARVPLPQPNAPPQTASGDETVLVWDVAGLVRELPAVPKPTPEDVEGLWAILGSPDPAKAHDAVWRLAAAPELSLPLLRERLPKVTPGAPGERVEKLLAELDDDDFDVRERATQELFRMGDQIAPAVRQARETTRSREVRRRADEVIEKWGRGPAGNPEEILTARGVEMLQRVGTPEARALLKSFADGPAGSVLAREARAALDLPSPPPPR